MIVGRQPDIDTGVVVVEMDPGWEFLLVMVVMRIAVVEAETVVGVVVEAETVVGGVVEAETVVGGVVVLVALAVFLDVAVVVVVVVYVVLMGVAADELPARSFLHYKSKSNIQVCISHAHDNSKKRAPGMRQKKEKYKHKRDQLIKRKGKKKAGCEVIEKWQPQTYLIM